MVLSRERVSFEKKLSQQLHWFSQLSETMTLRLLDIELRLSKLEANQRSHENSLDNSTKELLEESADVAKHLKNLLVVDSNKEKMIDNELISCMDDIDKCHRDASDVNELSSFESKDIEIKEDESNNFLETEYIDDPQMPVILD